MKRTVQLRRDVVTNTTITYNDAVYGGWKAINVGANSCTICGVTIAGGGASLDFYDLAPDVVWTSPITIDASSTTVVLLRLLYNESK